LFVCLFVCLFRCFYVYIVESLRSVARKDHHICMVTHREGIVDCISHPIHTLAIYDLERKYDLTHVRTRARYCSILQLYVVP
jgi:hypothetical protein